MVLYGDVSTGLDALRDGYQCLLPITDGIFTNLSVGACFAKLDPIGENLWKELATESQELLIINSNYGLYQFIWLRVDVKKALDKVRLVKGVMLSGLPGISVFLDNGAMTENGR